MSGPTGGRLVLARHAESEGNAAGVWQGQSGLGLTCRGFAQAAALADRLAAEEAVVAVVRSDQRRVVETAAPLLARTGWPERCDTRWRELDVGTWSGWPVDDVRRRDERRFAAFCAGQGPAGGDGETVADLRARVAAALADLQADVAGGGTAIVVTHGWALRAAVAELTHAEPGGEHDIAGVGNAALCVLDRGAGWEVTAYDDRSHLPASLRVRPPTAVA